MNSKRFKYLSGFVFFAALSILSWLSLTAPRWIILLAGITIIVSAWLAILFMTKMLRTAQVQIDTMNAEITLLASKAETKEDTLMFKTRCDRMDEMIPVIAHQWRQPLTSISMIAGTLQMEAMLDQYDQDHFVEKLSSISDIAGDLSTKISDFRHFFREDKITEETSSNES